jgi:XTP/dITP diphosphohydrolase
LELRELLEGQHIVKGLADIGCPEDIPETGSTLEENSAIKAEYVHNRYGIPCFADDTGLEVAALQGAPGVFSARYAGKHGDNEANIRLLLEKLKDVSDRRAQFRTIFTLIIDNEKTQFEGIIKGHIISEKKGSEGFGYDPIFVPNGYTATFAEMTSSEKNRISHRGIATKKLVEYLKSKTG